MVNYDSPFMQKALRCNAARKIADEYLTSMGLRISEYDMKRKRHALFANKYHGQDGEVNCAGYIDGEYNLESISLEQAALRATNLRCGEWKGVLIS